MLYANQVWGCPVRRPKVYRPKMGKKLANLNRLIWVIIDIDEKRFVVFEHTIDHLAFGYVRLTQQKNQFFCFAFFFLTCFIFLFLLPLSTFKPLHALHSNFERLKISRRTFLRQKSKTLGDYPESGLPNF